jgi:hypothetical protein
MSKSTLEQFIGKVRSEGLLTASHFYVVITPPFAWETQVSDIMMLCDSINLPSQTSASTDVRIFGENREHVYMPLYGQLFASFIVDRNMKVRRFFETWMDQVINRTTRTVGYYNNFVSNVDIFVTDKNAKVVYAIRCFEVFPKVLGDVRLDYASREILKISVDFSIKYWERLPVDENGNINENVDLRSLNIKSGIEKFSRDDFVRAGLFSIPTELSGSSLGFKSQGSTGLTGNFVKDISNIGLGFGSEANKSLTATYALIQSSPTGTNQTRTFGDSLRSLGNATGQFGTALASLGDGIRQISAPVAAISNATVGVANVLGTINTATSALGLGAPFAGAQSALAGAAGKLAVVSNVAGIPGQLGSIGAAMGAVGSTFESLTESMKQIPGGSQKISDSISSIGTIFQRRGNDIQESSSNLADGVTSGTYR